MNSKIELGLLVRDSITGFQGYVTGHCEYITGCNQSLLQPACKPDNEFVESRWFDDDRLTVVVFSPITLPSKTADGPDREAPRK